jgi:hypothetical protein
VFAFGALAAGLLAAGALAAGFIALAAAFAALAAVLAAVVAALLAALAAFAIALAAFAIALAALDIALLALAVALFEAASPQAIPKAPIARTAESTITFFILFKDSYLSQSINFLFPGIRLIKHSRFTPNSFLFKANVNIVRPETIVN